MVTNRRNRRRRSTSNNGGPARDNLVPQEAPAASSSLLRDDNDSPMDDMLPLYFPSTQIAFKLLLCAAFTSGVWAHITDCDETFNYWEPCHFCIFGKGLQTWEYAPQYAIRSYFYILLHAVPAYVYNMLFQPSRLLLFYCMRLLLGVCCTICAVYFYKSCCREFGVNVGRMVIVFLIFSPGMFISSTAFLPSTTSMYMTMLSIGAWYQRRYELAIMATAFSAFISWPFAGIIGFPIAIDALFRLRKVKTFFFWCLLSAVLFLIPQVQTDSSYFGRFVIAPWNIVKYNIFTSHGPDLYGTEPWYFYFLNGMLNFNFVFPLAMVTPLLLICVKYFVSEKIRHPECLPYELSLSSFYLWFLIFSFQPHKEERFLFPVYPLICLCGAVSVDALQMLWFRFIVKERYHYLRATARYGIIFLTIYAILGVSRMFALYKAYHAPMDTYIEFHKLESSIKGSPINVCIGKEWHRFPSSFFLPSDRWDIHFLPSEFRGLIPGKYRADVEIPTALVRDDMNDINKEEPSHYANIDICHFLVDLDTHKYTELEPDYSHHQNWTVVYSQPFLDAQRTPQWIRTFYVPFLWESRAKFFSYNLLKNNMKFKAAAI